MLLLIVASDLEKAEESIPSIFWNFLDQEKGIPNKAWKNLSNI